MRTNITLEQSLERASQRLREKILYSVELLRKAEKIALAYDDVGYYCSFSGGKDSQALYHIAELSGVKFKAHMGLTSVDPADVIRFVKKNYPEVELIKPKKSIYQLAVEKQILPSMLIRFCCSAYKEGLGRGRVVLIGIRHQESSKRAKRNEVEITRKRFSGDLEGLAEYRHERIAKKALRRSKKKGVNVTNADEEVLTGCISGAESILISPIIHWTDDDVWEFLNNVMQVPHCSLYDNGWKRIGCIGCPMSQPKQKRFENEQFPHVKRNWIKAIKKIRMGGGNQQYESGNNGWIAHPDAEHWIGGGKRQNNGVWSDATGFIDESKNLTEEEKENLIAENIFEWWQSGKPYKQWYADKFQQLQLNFDSKEEGSS